MENPKFQIFKSAANSQFYFRLRAKNGEIILSSEGYIAKSSCESGIASVKVNAPNDSRYDRRNNGASFSFNLKAANGEIIGRSESYKSESARDAGIESVKKEAPGAPVEDLTL